MDNEKRVVITVIKLGSYIGVGILAICFILELASNIAYINPVFLNSLAYWGIAVLIFTPVFTMLSISIYFGYKKQWKWAFTAIFVGILVTITFFVLK